MAHADRFDPPQNDPPWRAALPEAESERGKQNFIEAAAKDDDTSAIQPLQRWNWPPE